MTAETGLITLSFYRSEHEEELLSYRLPREQLHFTDQPKQALRACMEERERRPVVILAAEKVVGFFALQTGEEVREFSKERNAVLLRSFSVHESFQGLNIAGLALSCLPEFVNAHFPETNEIVLGVNERNDHAKLVYRRAGFFFTGKRKPGRTGVLEIWKCRILPET